MLPSEDECLKSERHAIDALMTSDRVHWNSSDQQQLCGIDIEGACLRLAVMSVCTRVLLPHKAGRWQKAN